MRSSDDDGPEGLEEEVETPIDTEEAARRHRSAVIGQTIIAALIGWAYLYNVVMKGHGWFEGMFQIIDTLTEDLVTNSVVTVVVGCGILLVFTATKLYTQIISNAFSFRILEKLTIEDFPHKRFKQIGHRLLNFQNEPEPDTVYPQRPSSVLIAFATLYVMSWIYLVLFSEALFFVSWSAGVDLPLTEQNLQLLPTLSLAIPFSARVMAYLRYPYTQDYADFMPGAVFVLLLVGSLGYLFESEDQKFFLLQIWQEDAYFHAFLQNGLLLAFIPVFTEALYWMLIIFVSEESDL
ncbi:MAG: hypothetical protein ACI8RZ_006763 [Myxococcota bacterium]|jgi:hypothetical protein